MTFEAELRAHLLGDSSIAALVGDQAANEQRIYPVQRPSGQKNVPAIVYTVLTGVGATNLDEGGDGDAGALELEAVRLQIDVWASSHDAARALGKLVQARLKVAPANKSIRAVRLSRQSDIDPDTREHREVLDYSVWHSQQQE